MPKSCGSITTRRCLWLLALCSTTVTIASALSLSTAKSMEPTSQTQPSRKPTLRTLSSTLSEASTSSAQNADGTNKSSALSERSEQMTLRAQKSHPLTEDELDDIVNSILNVAPHDAAIATDSLRRVLQETAHLSHKDWSVTGNNALELQKVLVPDGTTPQVRQILERILKDGNWDAAAQFAKQSQRSCPPWAVLVTGVNGIRKTTSLYQPWFPDLLQEALVVPPNQSKNDIPKQALPVGTNSFFRQLDHMIATLCNEDFARLYALTREELQKHNLETPTPDIVQQYSNLKAAIFSRYRTLSELLGALLLRIAQEEQSNCLLETSGRDIAMFHYVDHFFPKGYNKLALHFTINDLKCAQESVDARMIREIETGIRAVEKEDVFDVIYANAGGPYGSEVLQQVKEDSDRVWNDQVLTGKAGVGADWYKATIAIHAHPTKPWTAQAVRPDGSLGTLFTFANKV